MSTTVAVGPNELVEKTITFNGERSTVPGFVDVCPLTNDLDNVQAFRQISSQEIDVWHRVYLIRHLQNLHDCIEVTGYYGGVCIQRFRLKQGGEQGENPTGTHVAGI